MQMVSEGFFFINTDAQRCSSVGKCSRARLPLRNAPSEGRRAGNAEQRTGSGRMCEDKRGGLHVHA